jgi:hypothetical protein
VRRFNTKQAMAGCWVYKSVSSWNSCFAGELCLAQLHYAEGEVKSIPNYEYVIAQSRSEFTEQSLLRWLKFS